MRDGDGRHDAGDLTYNYDHELIPGILSGTATGLQARRQLRAYTTKGYLGVPPLSIRDDDDQRLPLHASSTRT